MKAPAQPAPSRLPRRIVSISLPDPVLEALEQARGREPRSAYVSRILADALRPPPAPPPLRAA